MERAAASPGCTIIETGKSCVEIGPARSIIAACRRIVWNDNSALLFNHVALLAKG